MSIKKMIKTFLLSLIGFMLIGIFIASLFGYFSGYENGKFVITSWFQHRTGNDLLLKAVESRKCLISKNLMSQDILNVWTHITDVINECSNDLFETLGNTTSLKHLLVDKFELKYFILPLKHASASCDVITLGIGGETESEEKLRNIMPQCKFLGIDSGAALSKEYYETRLGGTYVEGLVGAKNGTFSASVLENHSYIQKELQHFSFAFFLSTYFKENLIDLLFMDIEGDEFELMKEIIDNTELYPPICQINVEFHDSSKKTEIMLPLFNKLFGGSSYVAIKGGIFFSSINKFHLINIKNYECVKKYFIE